MAANNKPAQPQDQPTPPADETQSTPPADETQPQDQPTAPSVMTEAQMDRVTRDTAAVLAAQPKRTVRLYQVPKGSTESKLPDETVQINGYTYQIQRGVEVEVPETVYEILEQAGRV